MSNITPKFKFKTLVLGLAAMACSFATIAQEAGDINWKQWNVVVPLDSGGGISTTLKGKAAKKGATDPTYKKFFKQNSNNTIELRSYFTGVTEEGEFGNNQGKYSASEFVEVYGKKGATNSLAKYG